ncbi:MAG TPA: protein translocase SEC61 complex subunit gamma [Candidatus Acidoferrum sp.]|nr:protein translocase SEC61 complex subunit gamma [Candidatus Acidoferrum sp.]
MAKNEKSVTSKSNKQNKSEERSIWRKVERKLREYQRILTLTRRPSREEFTTIAKVAAIGIIAIGLAGFAIYLGMVIAPQNLGIKNVTSTIQNTTVPAENATMQVAANATVTATQSNVTSMAGISTVNLSNSTNLTP